MLLSEKGVLALKNEMNNSNRGLIIPTVMFVFYLGLLIFARIVVPEGPRKYLDDLVLIVILVYFFIPILSVIISIISSIIFKQMLYSLKIAGLNALLCAVLLYICIIYQLSPWTEIAWYTIYPALMLGIGAATSAIVLSIIYLYKKYKGASGKDKF